MLPLCEPWLATISDASAIPEAVAGATNMLCDESIMERISCSAELQVAFVPLGSPSAGPPCAATARCRVPRAGHTCTAAALGAASVGPGVALQSTAPDPGTPVAGPAGSALDLDHL